MASFVFQTSGDPSVGIAGDEVQVTASGFEMLDDAGKLGFLAGMERIVNEFYDGTRITIFDVTDDKADPKLVSLPRGKSTNKGEA